MSGVFGIVRRDGRSVDTRELECIGTRMAHRGPDGWNVWTDGVVGLGHLMLHSTPESVSERLPWTDLESGLVITADARIDNREELFAKLGSTLEPGLKVPDSQLILAAFKRWGKGCVDYLQGDFAIAIWDPREQKLFCARDRMGAAPLCYVVKEGYFAFASEAESLLLLPGISRQPNEELIAHILVPAFENNGDDRTWQSDVRALLPAHMMTASPGLIDSPRRYWELELRGEAVYASKRDCLEHFDEVFSEAVRCRLRAPGNIAMMMSGGLDSAGIAAMGNRLLAGIPEKTLNSYSAIDDDLASSVESQSILSMAGSLGVSPQYVSIPSFSGIINIEDVLKAAWQHAHPVDNMLLLPAMMCLAASRDGNRVMLHGASGDITMGLPRHYASIFLRKGRVLKAWRECVGASKNNVYLRGISPVTLMKQNLWRAYASEGMRKQRRRSQRGNLSSLVENRLIQPAFARRLNLVERLEEQYALEEKAALAPVDNPPSHQNLEYILWGLAGFNRIASRYGIEVRDPWADSRIFEFFMRLPVEYRVKNGWTKYLVRKSFRKELSPEVLWRRDKEHLGWKFSYRVMVESSDLIAGLMTREIEVLEEYIDPSAARALHERWVSSGEGIEMDALFELVTMILWLQRIKSL